MPIAKSLDPSQCAFVSSKLNISVEDDLFAELLGGLSVPYEIKSKKLYDFALLDDGIEEATQEFQKELYEVVKGSCAQIGDIDISKLKRPLIVHAKGKSATSAKVVEVLDAINSELKKQGRSMVVYPAHQELSSLDAVLAHNLRSALKITGVVPAMGVDSEIAEAFCRSTRECFEIQLKTPIKFMGGAIRGPGVVHNDCISGWCELEGGAVSVACLIILPVAMVGPLMKRMGHSDISNENFSNGPAEFANIVAGSARGALNALGYALRSPSLPKTFGSDSQHLLAAADSSTSIELKLENEFGECFLEIRFFS